MQVVFLGTGGYHPNERRHTACVMLPEVGVIFDAGTSFFRVPDRLQTEDVQIFLSHAHLDHVIGLTYFLAPMMSGQVRSAKVYGAESTLDAVRNHLFSEPLFPVMPDYEFLPLTAPVELPQGGTLTYRGLQHPGGCLGFRADWPDGSLAYITDTASDPTLREFVSGVDLLIHECYFPDKQAEWAACTGHSHTTPVAELAAAAGVGQLILVHLDPRNTADDPIGLEQARRIFPKTILGKDGLVWEST